MDFIFIISSLTGTLSLLELGEEYTFSLPCAYARSILTVPWVELGGKVSVNCAKTGYSASITFHTKPFYGGKLHRQVFLFGRTFFFYCSAVQHCKLIMCVSEMLLKRDTRNYSTYASIHLFVYAEDLENASKEVKTIFVKCF